MRSLCAAVLTCEAILLALSIPVAVRVLGTDAVTAGVIGGGQAVGCLLIAGLLRFRWALIVGSVLQVLILATGFMVPTMFFLGFLFGALWVIAIWLGYKVEAAQAR